MTSAFGNVCFKNGHRAAVARSVPSFITTWKKSAGYSTAPPIGRPTHQRATDGPSSGPSAWECSAIHLTASCSVMKPLIASVSPSGHRTSTPQPDPGFFRATKVGRCSNIQRICACGGPVQASYPATIKLNRYQCLLGGAGALAGRRFGGLLTAFSLSDRLDLFASGQHP
jgi:hypothetical protein